MFRFCFAVVGEYDLEYKACFVRVYTLTDTILVRYGETKLANADARGPSVSLQDVQKTRIGSKLPFGLRFLELVIEMK